jgi:nucleoside-diphosphate-sugar epimerase
MRVLVVGGAGYVGGAVTDLLQQPFYHPTPHSFQVYDSLLYEDQFRKPVPFCRGDVRDHSRLLPLLHQSDVVLWLAALVGDGACALDPPAAVEVNQESVRWLAENFPGRIIFLSTCSVYGQGEGELTESSPTNPLSVYATTKLAAEQTLADHPNCLIFRLGTLFGLSDHFSRVRFDLVVNTLTLRAQREGRLTVFGGDQFRPLLHVRDAAEAIVSAIPTRQTGIYNLRYRNYSISELADLVAAEFPGLEITSTPQHFEDHRNYRVSSLAAARDLRFYPRRTVSEGIREIKRLLDEGRLTNPDHARHGNERHLAARRMEMEAAR